MIIQSSIHCCVCWFICRLFNDSKQELGWAELYTEYGKTTGWCPTFSDTQISSFMVTRSICKNESAGADSKKKRHWNWSRGLSCEVIVMSHYVPLKLPFVCFGHHVQTQPCSKQPPFSPLPSRVWCGQKSGSRLVLLEVQMSVQLLSLLISSHTIWLWLT
jgi:hypothetical protein